MARLRRSSCCGLRSSAPSHINASRAEAQSRRARASKAVSTLAVVTESVECTTCPPAHSIQPVLWRTGRALATGADGSGAALP